jgi:hypothetical protein
MDAVLGLTKQTITIVKLGLTQGMPQRGMVMLRYTTGIPGGLNTTVTSAFASSPGEVPTDATAGFPPLNIPAGKVGYLTRFVGCHTVGGARHELYDLLYAVHEPAITTTGLRDLSSAPSYASRVPRDADYADCALYYWHPLHTAHTGNVTMTVTYTNQAGVSGRSTTVTIVPATAATFTPIPLQLGDVGVRRIESYNITASATATVDRSHLVVARRIYVTKGRGVAGGFATSNGGCYVDGPVETGLPTVMPDSALFVSTSANTSSAGVNEQTFDIGWQA